MAGILTVQTIQGPTSGANANKVIIPAGQTLDIASWTPPAGTVVQVLQDTKTDYQSASSNGGSWTNISGLSVSITPSSTSSKIFVFSTIQMHSNGNMFLRIIRNSTPIGVGDLVGNRGQAGAGDGYNPDDNRNQNFTLQHLDSPSTTSAVTYQVQFVLEATNKVGVINGALTNLDAVYRPYYQSTLTVMEIAG